MVFELLQRRKMYLRKNKTFSKYLMCQFGVRKAWWLREWGGDLKVVWETPAGCLGRAPKTCAAWVAWNFSSVSQTPDYFLIISLNRPKHKSDSDTELSFKSSFFVHFEMIFWTVGCKEAIRGSQVNEGKFLNFTCCLFVLFLFNNQKSHICTVCLRWVWYSRSGIKTMIKYRI